MERCIGLVKPEVDTYFRQLCKQTFDLQRLFKLVQTSQTESNELRCKKLLKYFKMCNVNEDEGACHIESKPKALMPGTLCRKCQREKAQIVLQIKDAYCRGCFFAFCAHKFRAIVGKSRIFHGSAAKPVLLAFSGSGSSVTLLKLVMEAISMEPQQRRLMAQPSILYIDEGAITECSCATREIQCRDILTAVKHSGFPVYVAPLTLGEVFPKELTMETENVDRKYDKEVVHLFESLSDLTSKIDMLHRIRHCVLVRVAQKLGIDKVFLSETATTLATKILTSIALGRGAQIPIETGFLDDRENTVIFLRPMKDFSNKEVGFFNRFHQLDSVFIPSLLTKSNINSSIQRLTENFVISVQSEFPSTVSTIYRTGDKLKVSSTNGGECGICILCRGPLDTDPKDCSALEATEFSRVMSFGSKIISDDRTDCGKTHCTCANQSSLELEQVLSVLCYSCRLLARNMTSVNFLPLEILEKIKDQISLKQMRKEIQDFLLE